MMLWMYAHTAAAVVALLRSKSKPGDHFIHGEMALRNAMLWTAQVRCRRATLTA